MPNALRFETPENVQVQYEPAGLGTRFVAWFVDEILLIVGVIALMIALVAAGASFESVFGSFDGNRSKKDDQAILYFVGLIILVWGLSSFVYFGCCELFLRGQTIGKRVSKIRVLKSNGFQLDAGSILVRNLFRVLDNLPPMWLFPLISRVHQRAGDMVAGTIVVFDAPVSFSPVRTELAGRTAADAEFRFDASKLKRLAANDFMAIERVLDRLPSMKPEEQFDVLQVYVVQVAKKLGIDPPPIGREQRFLEDLFAAELRRQDRSLA
jgi:uncharacterized RDD family membrane protein YckC